MGQKSEIATVSPPEIISIQAVHIKYRINVFIVIWVAISRYIHFVVSLCRDYVFITKYGIAIYIDGSPHNNAGVGRWPCESKK
jgi:hypothetical protein